MTKKSFIIVDDHSLMRQGIAASLEKNSSMHCAGDAGSIAEARNLIDQLASEGKLPAVIIEDLNLGNEDGLSFVREVQKNHPEVKCLVYSMYTGSSMVQRCLNAGATGYISKNSTEQEFINAIETVAAGKQFIEQDLLAPLVAFNSSIESLTKRERDVLELLLSGKSNSEIAIELHIEKCVVENYLSRIYAKTECTSRAELCTKFGA